jgi:hypothetical protein
MEIFSEIPEKYESELPTETSSAKIMQQKADSNS